MRLLCIFKYLPMNLLINLQASAEVGVQKRGRGALVTPRTLSQLSLAEYRPLSPPLASAGNVGGAAAGDASSAISSACCRSILSNRARTWSLNSASLAPAVVNAVSIQVLNLAYAKLAVRLTNRENWKTDQEHADALILRMFLFQFTRAPSTAAKEGRHFPRCCPFLRP